MDHFELTSENKPAGDQPKAISSLFLVWKKDFATRLYWGHGSGKTFTIANVIQEINRPSSLSLTIKLWQHSFATSFANCSKNS